MRTTLKLDDALIREAKKRAVDTHQTLTAVIEDALRQSLGRGGKKEKPRPVRLPTIPGRVRPGIDLSNSAELYDLLDEELALSRR